MLAMLLPASLAIAQTGVVAGTIVDAATRRPLNGVRVQIVGDQNLATASDDRGRYAIRLISVGPHSLRASRIGMSPISQSFTIRAGDTTHVDIQLNETSVELSQVVVTGTGGAVEKRQIGASIGTVDASAMTEQTAVNDVGRLLESKVSGLRATTVGGGVGTGQDIRIRGIASLSLDQRPAIYIDGVRADKRATEWFSGGACCSFGGGASTDRLGDINPDDIDHIEVLKGAAAATLYGSEATNGVIQIFTKRGRSGERPTEWNMSVGTGYDELRHNLPTTLFPLFTGPDGTRALDANKTMIKQGPYQSVDLSATGGSQRTTYFSSFAFSKEVGSIQPNDQTKANLRLNLTFVPNDKWTIETRSSYVRNLVNEIQAGNNWTALLGNAINGNPRTASVTRPYGEAWVPVADIQTMTTQSDVDRWTGGVTLTHATIANMSNRLTVGVDATNDHKNRFFPYAGAFGPAGVTNGQKNLGIRNYKSYTVDYLGQYRFSLPFGIESNLSWGGQGFWDIEDLLIAVGNTFAGPGVSSLSSSATTQASENYTETINMGFLAQDRFSFKDQLFLTVGLRIDGNSAFGKNYGYKRYPKVDLSYDMTKGGYLPSWISSARVRGAIGQAGKMPGPFDSFTSYASTPVFASGIGIIPLNPGNPNLRPERSTETEGGLEAGFFKDILGVEFTLFHQTTNDAIVPKSYPPSAGFSTAQSVNIGEIQNHGWEAAVNYRVYATGKMDWTTGFKLDGNQNKITNLGGVNLGNNSFRVGYPVGGVWDRIPTGFSVVHTGNSAVNGLPCPVYGCPVTTRSDTAVYLGPGLPTFNTSWSNQIRYSAFSFYVLFTMERGAVFGNGDRPYRIRQGGSDEYLGALGPGGASTFKSDSIAQFASILNYNDSRNSVRLREVSVSWSLPARLTSPVGLGTSSLTLSGQNLWWWDHCNCVDPNMNWAGASAFTFNNGFLEQPAARLFRFEVRTRF
jgi:TonB-dependent SusC/RagA subfamily outer membrane receptor